ncbi:S-layer homology domain-containing protein [Caldalkalibacillus mannanilyticus]|uniref:S-layer homology domain-containing protein n=1 Tax=Caldalkalibacillus mannanilyticus TaxID=1418 RepID=UPI00046955FA|nr:S-layer homology domain-containing protein [Caldalkalibacillus mannanilyticus]
MKINLKKGIVATTLTCSLLLSSPFQGVQAAELRDIQGHWAQEDIAYVVNNGIQIPFGNEIFAPKDEITRAEFTSLVVQALQYESDGASSQVFSDVPLDLWYSPDIQIAFEEGIIQGDEKGLFRPDDLITRAEIATIIHRTFSDLDLIRPKVSFRDVGQKHWAYDSISFASQAGIVVGHRDFTFKPIQPATRAEAFVMISRILRVVFQSCHQKLNQTSRFWNGMKQPPCSPLEKTQQSLMSIQVKPFKSNVHTVLTMLMSNH